MKLWGGRFTKETDQLVFNFNESLSFDRKFYKQDIKGSLAHVRMLGKQGIISEDEMNTIRALDTGKPSRDPDAPGRGIKVLKRLIAAAREMNLGRSAMVTGTPSDIAAKKGNV